jgi:hypothetical protein
MGKIRAVVVLGGLAMGARALLRKRREGTATPTARETATGTDPHAKWSQPGYEDKSFGQAVNQDQQLVEQLAHEAGGDLERAEAEFKKRSAGAPALARQDNSE